MGAFISMAVGALLSILLTVLPTSPFLGMTLSEEFDRALGWLNWVLPVDAMLALLTAWILAGVLWAVVQFVITKVDGLVGK